MRELWPEIWAMVKPRRGILFLGFILIVVKTLSGLVLPGSTRYLIDDVIVKHQSALLMRLVLLVIGATAVQGVTSF